MKIKNIILTIIFIVCLFSISAFCFIKPADEYSLSERRPLASFPEISADKVLGGEFMEGFEKYTADQFPFRDRLRNVKAIFSTKVLRKLDNNGLFTADGHISKIDATENEYMMDYAAELFSKIVKDNMTDKNAKIYFSIVPDKNMFLADKNGYPSLDYNGFIERMKSKTGSMSYIDIIPLLGANDYYYTDTHWKQEKITDIADALLVAMGGEKSNVNYTINTLNNPFYGVYHGQLAMPFSPDTIKYLTNETIDNCTVTYYGDGVPTQGEMYNMEKAVSKDPYEMFLSGTMPLLTIENTTAKSEKELVMFRDSFGSSIAPLLAEGYKKITLVDVRYINSGFIKNFVNFENADVLFLYSTSLLNNSLAMK